MASLSGRHRNPRIGCACAPNGRRHFGNPRGCFAFGFQFRIKAWEPFAQTPSERFRPHPVSRVSCFSESGPAPEIRLRRHRLGRLHTLRRVASFTAGDPAAAAHDHVFQDAQTDFAGALTARRRTPVAIPARNFAVVDRVMDFSRALDDRAGPCVLGRWLHCPP